ncbi:putative ankyrin repeat-containing domain, PGG domain, ankyrin repeat-containing domain superfamily [Helianthus annuus]|nr:putative ankyrin repeat-containing domain, PGG domain, ankyrin repeat-containing domain superfamily [Helianthus annuus]
MFKPSKSSRPFNFQSYLKNRSGFWSCDRCRGITYQLTHSNPLMNQQPPSPTQPQQQTSPPSQQQQQQAQTPPPPHSQQPPLQPHHLQQQPQQPNLPCFDLVRGGREEYLKIGVPLYEASIKCNWKAAEAILDKRRELVGYSITENGETPLHVAASAKGDPKRVEEFVKNLVGMMTQKQLELQNKNYNTALYLAAAAGNVETAKIMVKENRKLLTIIGSNKTMMPLYAAALFGNKDVVAYIYEQSKSLSDDENWSRERRGWLLEKCVENNMFDVALKIAKKHPLHDNGRSILRILARKPERFQETKSNFMGAAIKSVFGFFGIKMRAPEKESALPLLRFLWDDIVKKSTSEIDAILRGPPDTNDQDSKTSSKWAVQTMQLQKVIIEYVEKMNTETRNIKGLTDSTNQDTSSATIKKEQALALQKLISESLVNMHHETQKIIKDPSSSIKKDNKPISNKEHLAQELQKLIFKHIADMHDNTLKIINTIQIENRARLLQQGIFERIEKLRKESEVRITKYGKDAYSSRVLFIAAEMGNTNFLIELIRGYPDLIWKVNDNNQSIFHIAVKHRHEGIYNLLYEIGAMKDLITPLKDLKDNNMLHLVGKIAKQNRLKDISGVALQMRLELLWFHEVKKMIPLSYRERENEDGLTPHELFTREHKDLVTLGEKWMKGTASQCMVVAALIATIVFAATFTVPGGYAQNNGIPFFHSKATFVVFVVADAISLISSSASILMFLSILTSRYAEYDFLESLPRKLLFGLATLFLSITTMMVAFGVSFFVLYDKGLLWIPILICVLVVFPALLYVRLQYKLFIDVIRSTYRSRYLFKPKKSVLYYENPKV